MDLLGRIFVAVLVAGIAAAGTWWLRSAAWPSYAVVALGVALWLAAASAIALLLRRPEQPDRKIIDQLRSRAQRRER